MRATATEHIHLAPGAGWLMGATIVLALFQAGDAPASGGLARGDPVQPDALPQVGALVPLNQKELVEQGLTGTTPPAKSDTTWVLGGPADSLGGRFQTASGAADPQGWICVDRSGTGVGAFGQVWNALDALGPSSGLPANRSPRWGFVDDGMIVPGTGGSSCWTWCYGPYGWTLNATGGLAGPGNYLWNEIHSPVLPWPAHRPRAVLGFDAFVHEPLRAGNPGMCVVWHVRSTASSDPADIAGAAWRDRGVAYYGGPDEVHVERVITDLLVPGARYVQLALGVAQLGQAWGIIGLDVTPGPYFDNVTVRGESADDPLAFACDFDMAQDSFPESGAIDLVHLGTNTVRYDAARNSTVAPILGAVAGRNGEGIRASDPGDSTSFKFIPAEGTVLDGAPLLRYRLRKNPLFDTYRSSGYPAEGAVELQPSGDFWRVDLPDSGFLYPGDLLHAFVEVRDTGGGLTIFPGDTTGYSVFPARAGYDPFGYPPEFAFRALPSLHTTTPGDQPPVLLWFDTTETQERAVWSIALRNLGLREGVDFDLYYTNGAGSGLGNGIDRATAAQLAGYRSIIYTCGHATRYTLATLEAGETGDDVTLLSDWLAFGERKLVMFGDNVASELAASSTVGPAFLSAWLGISVVHEDVASSIENQTHPEAFAVAGNAVLGDDRRWVVNADPALVTPDAVVPLPGTTRIAEFAARGGGTGSYIVAAATWRRDPVNLSDVLLFPFAFATIVNGPGHDPGEVLLAARTQLLGDILGFCGHPGPWGSPTEVPRRPRFSASSAPNPFNPRLTIAYDLPVPGRLRVEVFDLRGRLVRTLMDAEVPAGPGRLSWDGMDAEGRAAASGLYVWRARALDRTVMQKVSLVR
ncbi:MAG: FlgD immunoglobulin-like domain containing protein [Candidatus Krumholzibacteriia bacterium]